MSAAEGFLITDVSDPMDGRQVRKSETCRTLFLERITFDLPLMFSFGTLCPAAFSAHHNGAGPSLQRKEQSFRFEKEGLKTLAR